MTRAFTWTPERTEGVWRYGLPCLKPLVAAAPWLTVGLLLILFEVIGGTLVSDRGVLVDLPDARQGDGDATGPVALVMPAREGTIVFFDDSRYLIGDPASLASLADNLSASLAKSTTKNLLALVDRRVSSGDLMRLTALARRSGVERVLIAEKRKETEE